jgi:hypothetical protein
VLTFLTESFSVSLSLLKVGTQGCDNGYCPSLLDSFRRSLLRVFEHTLSLGADGLPGTCRFSEVVLSGAGL